MEKFLGNYDWMVYKSYLAKYKTESKPVNSIPL